MITQTRKNAFHELVWRGNIITRNFRGKTIIIYEDHRYLLNILYYARRKGILKKIPNLIYFDKHDDANPPGRYLNYKLQNIRNYLPSIQDFWNFVEFDLSPYDDNWLKSGMELALIQHALLFEGQSWLGLQNIESYNDANNNNHQLINGGDFTPENIAEKTFIDHLINFGFFHLHNLLANTHHKANPDIYRGGFRPFVLDFDLDCFSETRDDEQLMGRSESQFLNKYDTTNETSPLQLIRKLAEKAAFITIAKESDYCGGIRQSFNNLALLDKYIFKGTILGN